MSGMKGGREYSKSERLRGLQVTGREALTLLAALEISPFEDEVLEQKLLHIVYSESATHLRRRATRTPDLTHLRRGSI